MSMDVVGDFLTVIRNALMVYKRTITVPHSSLKADIAKVLKDEGFIKDFSKAQSDKGHAILNLSLKYVDGESAINGITRISKPGRRYYERSSKITPVVGGLGVSILTTSSGVITDQQARKLSVGGEIICHVW